MTTARVGWSHPVALDLYRNRTHQKMHRHHDSLLFFHFHQQALSAFQGTPIHSDSLTRAQVRPRLRAQPGSNGSLNRGDLGVLNSHRNLPQSDKVLHPGNGQRQAADTGRPTGRTGTLETAEAPATSSGRTSAGCI